MPAWLRLPLLGAVLSAAGYLGTTTVGWWQARQQEHATSIARLQKLQILLKASHKVFEVQLEQVGRLTALLQKSHPKESGESQGYEETVSRCFATMNAKEKELHGIIRGYTEHSMRKVNQAMTDWLKEDVLFKTGNVPSARAQALADELFALEIHLLFWHAKFDSWIPNHPEHALVYMVDEYKHGLGFPSERAVEEKGAEIKHRGVDVEVAVVLDELRKKWL